MMNYKQYYKYLLALMFGIFVMHFGMTILLSGLTSFFYHDSMLNIRHLHDQERIPMTQVFLSSAIRSAKKPIFLVLGTSFSYGHGLRERDVYTHQLRKSFKTHQVIHASVVGESGLGIFQRIAYMKLNHYSVDRLFIELSLFNLTSSNGLNVNSASEPYSMSQYVNLPINSYFRFYFRHPHGIYALSALDINRLYTVGAPASHNYNGAPIVANYIQRYDEFRKDFPIYRDFLYKLLNISKDVSNHVTLFISPVYADAIKASQFKLDNVEKQMQAILNVCEDVSDITCLTPGLQSEKSYFMNVSHYNRHGHKALSKWLIERLPESEHT